MPDYQLTVVYPGLTGVFVDNVCIGVVIPSRACSSEQKKVFFCYETAICYYGLTEDDAVEAYLKETHAID